MATFVIFFVAKYLTLLSVFCIKKTLKYNVHQRFIPFILVKKVLSFRSHFRFRLSTCQYIFKFIILFFGCATCAVFIQRIF